MNLIFNGLGILLLGQFVRYKILDYIRETDKSTYWKIKRHKYILTVAFVLLLVFAIIELLLPEISPLKDDLKRLHFEWVLGISIAGSISVIWTIYLRKLDVFEPEKWSHIIVVFILGCVTVWLVFPITRFIQLDLSFRLNGGFVNDFLYCWLSIGLVEEVVKFIPLIIIVQFRKIVNEPYDFLLYASVSALGFAFVENTMYLERTDFYATNGRALMSTVAHMTFSSVIGYAVMIASCRRPGKGWYYVVGGFLIASLMHGFYDFWLINPIAKQFNGLSFLFFIASTHLWFTLKNNAINASYFYDASIKLTNESLRFFIVFWMIIILFASVLLIGIFHGKDSAHVFLKGQILTYGFLIYYLGFSFSRYQIAPKALAACQVAFEKVIPDEPEPREDWESFYEEKKW